MGHGVYHSCSEGPRWLERVLMVLICSKVQAVPFRGGFPASRPALLLISGSHFVANSKSGSFSGSNATPRSSVTLVVTLVLRLRPPTELSSLPCGQRRRELLRNVVKRVRYT